MRLVKKSYWLIYLFITVFILSILFLLNSLPNSQSIDQAVISVLQTKEVDSSSNSLSNEQTEKLVLQPNEVNSLSNSLSKEQAEELILQRIEVKNFIKYTPDYILFSDINKDGTYHIEFHTRGNGTVPLWNYYIVDNNGNILDMFNVYDDEGNFVCSQATEPDDCRID